MWRWLARMCAADPSALTTLLPVLPPVRVALVVDVVAAAEVAAVVVVDSVAAVVAVAGVVDSAGAVVAAVALVVAVVAAAVVGALVGAVVAAAVVGAGAASRGKRGSEGSRARRCHSRVCALDCSVASFVFTPLPVLCI